MTDTGNTDTLGDAEFDQADPAYDAGWHDGCDWGYRLAKHETTCPACGDITDPATRDPEPPASPSNPHPLPN